MTDQTKTDKNTEAMSDREKERKTAMDEIVAQAIAVRASQGSGHCYDPKLHLLVRMETPFGLPKSADSKPGTEKILTPGCKLKTVATDGIWPKHFGALCVYDKDHDIVAVCGQESAGQDSGRWVWVGTCAEYASTWLVD